MLLLEKAVGLVSRDTVAVTWAANFDAVEKASPAAAEVLRFSALLASDAIPFEFFLDGAQALGGSIADVLADPDDLSLGEVLRPLARYSLVRSDAGSRSFGVHRLVQEIVWTAVAEAERATYVERALLALDAGFPEVDPQKDAATQERCERYVAHVTALAERVDFYGVEPGVAAYVLQKTARYLFARGRYGEARSLFERSLAIRERALGPDHPDVAVSLSNLAIANDEQGRYAEAQAFLERSLAIRERAFGPDHPIVVKTIDNLALVRWRRGRYADSQALWERSLSLRERTCSPDDPDVAHSLTGLALVLFEQGRYAAARVADERALAIQERAFGPDHPRLAFNLTGLGYNDAKQGRYAEAQALYERSPRSGNACLGRITPTWRQPDVPARFSRCRAVAPKRRRCSSAR